MGSVTSDSWSQDIAFRKGGKEIISVCFKTCLQILKAENFFFCQLNTVIWKEKSPTKREALKPMWIKKSSIGTSDITRLRSQDKDTSRSR